VIASPTSVLFFDDSEAEQKIPLSNLSDSTLFENICADAGSDATPADLSNSAHSKLPDFSLPSVSASYSACKALTVLSSTFQTPITTLDVSSTSEKGSDFLYFSYAQDPLLNSITTLTFSSDLPHLLIMQSFFSYWFDGFMPSQCLYALIILTFLFNDPFDDVVSKVRLSKYLKYVINCLDLACTKAGLRAAKSIASVAATIAVLSPESLQSVDLRSSSGFRFSDGLCPSKTATLGSATDLRTSTSSLNSA
jgi:hypothetical protein